METPDGPSAQVGRREAFAFWLKLGFIGFGGPAGQIALMHEELVVRRRWISEKRFLHALNYCMLLPGPEAQQLATYIGWLMHRTWGGVVAGVLFVLPSLFILIALSWIYMLWGHTPLVAGLFEGVKPAVAALVLQAAHRLGSRTLRNRSLLAVAVASFLASWGFSVPFPWIVGLAAMIGLVGARLAPDRLAFSDTHASRGLSHAPALIDDDTPTPAHARFLLTRSLRVVLVGALLWCLPMLGLVVLYGVDHTLTRMGLFFTQAAWLTFGGAYAVLPYVYQGAVEQFGWLSAGQMMDGLALGETTPGPLIMVVAFVGFVGGYLQALFGPDTLWLSGTVAACVVTWFTFLPSFILILAGGPLVESTQGQRNFIGPLTAISAAVVGVILNLAFLFAYPVLWPDGLDGALNVTSGLIAAGAAVALLYFRRSAIQVIGVSAVVGLLLSWIH